MGARYLCADVGGTQIKAAVLEETGEPAGGIERFDACSGLPRDALLGHLAGCLAASAAGKGGVRGVRLAMPGPFDYENGICLIDGLGKYAALYGTDLRAELGARLRGALGGAAEDIRFINDVAAFALGELRFGCARGTERAGIHLHRHRLRKRLQRGRGPGAGGGSGGAGGRLHLPAAAARTACGRLALAPRALRAEPPPAG